MDWLRAQRHVIREDNCRLGFGEKNVEKLPQAITMVHVRLTAAAQWAIPPRTFSGAVFYAYAEGATLGQLQRSMLPMELSHPDVLTELTCSCAAPSSLMLMAQIHGRITRVMVPV
jgi:hypothetical protein